MQCRLLAIFIFLILSLASQATALPFNDDMVNDQLKDGDLMRPRAEGSMPIGYGERHVDSREDAQSMSNPNPKGDLQAVLAGKWLYATNCLPCHGEFTNDSPDSWVPGRAPKLAGGMMREINLGMPQTLTGNSDGHFFEFTYFGSPSGIMPRYGYKLSKGEIWNIVSYVRSVQSASRKK